MKAIAILAICLVSEIHCLSMCTLMNPKAKCKLSVDCDGEIVNYGSYACVDPNVCCVAPDSTTSEPTTEPPTTETPSTTEEPTTTPTTTVLPVTEQCGVKPTDDLMFRILGGNPKLIRDWPWMVSIRGKDIQGATDLTTLAAEAPRQENTLSICSGVFIHEQYVVTTGFCLLRLYAMFKTQSITFDPLNNILLNAGDTNNGVQDFDADGTATEKQLRVTSIIPHGSFVIQNFETDVYDLQSLLEESATATYSPNNLALLKLEQPVVFNEYLRKCCGPNLTESATCSLKKSDCFVAGWGDIAEDGTKNDGMLKDAAVEVFSKEVVDAASQFTSDTIPALHSVAKFTSPPGSICDGDNGGMVVCKNDEGRWALEGLVSRAEVGGACQPSDAFNIVDIKAAWPWIDGIINP